jgi:phosphoribosyl 1,2-cyclic phosphodiesterase
MSKGLLIDAGIGIRNMKKRLVESGLDFGLIWGVLITHDHIDHIRSVGAVAARHHIPVYTTATIHKGIARCPMLGDKIIPSPHNIEKGETIDIARFEVTAFAVSHDGSDNVGYTIQYNGKRFTVATDLGYICENSAPYIRQANYLVLEANYDVHMLETGRYPRYLKNRISSKTGHLSNDEAAQFLAENYAPHLSHIYLCHLSQENNMPELAYHIVKRELTAKGITVGKDVQLHALPRTKASDVFILET